MDDLLPILKLLLHQQTVMDLETQVGELKAKVNRIKEELNKEKKANIVKVNNLNGSMDGGYISEPADVLNKAKLFNAGLAKNPISIAKVIPVLVHFNQKMEDLLTEMQSLFDGLEAQQPLSLDQVPNLSINTEELPNLYG